MQSKVTQRRPPLFTNHHHCSEQATGDDVIKIGTQGAICQHETSFKLF
jgi:hypothetical protein